MVNACLIEAVVDPNKMVLSVSAIAVSVLFLILLKRYDFSKKTKISLIYGHLISLFFPIAVMSTSAVCGLFCLPCGNDMLSLILYALPTTLLLSTISGFIVIPLYLLFTNRDNEIKSGYFYHFVRTYSQKLGIKTPKLFILNKAKPLAFSFKNFRSAVFLSAGMFDVLRRKEIEAVILHELAHINFKSSIFKMSAFLMKFSPLSVIKSFKGDLNDEEMRADKFVVKEQGTGRHLSSAKKRIEEWDSI